MRGASVETRKRMGERLSDMLADDGWEPDPAGVYFSERFGIDPQVLEEYGAFDISVVTDMPLFIPCASGLGETSIRM